MNNITVLLTLKNNVLIRDDITGYIWLYSYNEPVAYYNGKVHVIEDNLTQATKFHIAEFKKFFKK